MSLLYVDPAAAGACNEQAWKRTVEVVTALESAEDPEGPTLLEGWSRLTVACHLRYGALGSRRVTTEALAGREAAFYPEGRSVQRPGTLAPAPGESAADVFRALAEEGRLLYESWRDLSAHQWRTDIVEPADNPDYGSISISVLPLLRLTEVEVHGSDLDLGLGEWSDTFVEVALPTRIAWLAIRRRDPSLYAPDVQGSWLLAVSGGPRWLVTVSGEEVESRTAGHDDTADATIEGTGRDVLAMLLGRPGGQLDTSGDSELAGSFKRAFPGP
jgi:Mycothiol maleylpyruvate isomerase N-terminal domain